VTGATFWLTLTLVLAASLWIPYIVGVNRHLPAGIDAFRAPYDQSVLPDWVQRANRAHVNLIEQGMPFAALVLLALHLGVTSPAVAWAAAAFFWLRLAHAAGMITGWARNPARPLIFTAGWVCCLVVAGAILAG
jgi:uncharacterized MAPEG superfamily protein